MEIICHEDLKKLITDNKKENPMSKNDYYLFKYKPIEFDFKYKHTDNFIFWVKKYEKDLAKEIIRYMNLINISVGIYED